MDRSRICPSGPCRHVVLRGVALETLMTSLASRSGVDGLQFLGGGVLPVDFYAAIEVLARRVRRSQDLARHDNRARIRDCGSSG